MRKSREKENKSLLRVQDYTNDKRKLKTKAIPDYFPWPTAFMLTGPKKGLSFQANTDWKMIDCKNSLVLQKNSFNHSLKKFQNKESLNKYLDSYKIK